MEMFLSTLACILGLLTQVSQQAPAPAPEYKEECFIWEDVTSRLNNKGDVQMRCLKNTPCTGFDCTGKYEYQGQFTGNEKFQIEYCFGMAIHPCSHPVDMHFYVSFPDFNTTYQHNVNHDDRVQVPGLHYPLAGGASADVFVEVHMDVTTVGGKNYVKLGMKLKIRVSFAGFHAWPDALARTLMPDTLIPVPPCDSRVTSPPVRPVSCTRYQPPATKTTRPSQATTTAYPREACDINDFQSCSHDMMCVRLDKGSYCLCMYGHDEEGSKCRAEPTPAPTPVIIVDPYPKTKPNSQPSKGHHVDKISAQTNNHLPRRPKKRQRSRRKD